MRNKKIPMYLDGFIKVYRPNESKSNFGAKKNIKSVEEMTHIIDLAYSQSYKRVQDIDFAETVGRDLSLKIKTRLVHSIKLTDKIVIDGILYDIINLDEDRVNHELYLYLEEMYPIE